MFLYEMLASVSTWIALSPFAAWGTTGTGRHPDGAPGGDSEIPPALCVSGRFHEPAFLGLVQQVQCSNGGDISHDRCGKRAGWEIPVQKWAGKLSPWASSTTNANDANSPKWTSGTIQASQASQVTLKRLFFLHRLFGSKKKNNMLPFQLICLLQEIYFCIHFWLEFQLFCCITHLASYVLFCSSVCILFHFASSAVFKCLNIEIFRPKSMKLCVLSSAVQYTMLHGLDIHRSDLLHLASNKAIAPIRFC